MRIFFPLVLLVLAACHREPETILPVKAECRNPLAGCVIAPGISLRFSQRPSVMRAFDLEVAAPEATGIHASFQMETMDMGMNRYRLLRENGRWRARVMLPACVQGKRDWLLRLEVGRKVYEVPFVAE